MGIPGGPGSVGGQGLLHPGHKCSDAGVHGGCGCGARAAAPGHDACQGPDSVLLADQGAARVALQEETGLCKPERSCQVLVCLELAEPRECRPRALRPAQTAAPALPPTAGGPGAGAGPLSLPSPVKQPAMSAL